MSVNGFPHVVADGGWRHESAAMPLNQAGWRRRLIEVEEEYHPRGKPVAAQIDRVEALGRDEDKANRLAEKPKETRVDSDSSKGPV